MRITCRDEILVAVKALINLKGINEFHTEDIVEYMKKLKSS